jgi:hypothetical protein
MFNCSAPFSRHVKIIKINRKIRIPHFLILEPFSDLTGVAMEPQNIVILLFYFTIE